MSINIKDIIQNQLSKDSLVRIKFKNLNSDIEELQKDIENKNGRLNTMFDQQNTVIVNCIEQEDLLGSTSWRVTSDFRLLYSTKPIKSLSKFNDFVDYERVSFNLGEEEEEEVVVKNKETKVEEKKIVKKKKEGILLLDNSHLKIVFKNKEHTLEFINKYNLFINNENTLKEKTALLDQIANLDQANLLAERDVNKEFLKVEADEIQQELERLKQEAERKLAENKAKKDNILGQVQPQVPINLGDIFSNADKILKNYLNGCK